MIPSWLINVLTGLVPAILVAVVTAVTAVFLALRRFRQERWWDKKEAMYAEKGNILNYLNQNGTLPPGNKIIR